MIVQADTRFRDQVEDIKRLHVRNAAGDMVPAGDAGQRFVDRRPARADALQHVPRGRHQWKHRAGFSTGQGIVAFENVARRELPQAMSIEWTELAYLEQLSSNTGMVVFAFSVIFVVPCPGGALRELDDAAGRDSSRADVRAVLDRRRRVGQYGHQYLHADRLRRFDRPGVQKPRF